MTDLTSRSTTRRPEPTSRFEFNTPVLIEGQGSIAQLDEELDAMDIDAVLVICNPSISKTPAVIDPVADHLGDRLAGIFSDVSSKKRLRTAWDAAEQARSVGATGIVAVGAGSALDVATVTAALVDDPRSKDDLIQYFTEHRTIPIERLPCPLFMVPTTLAGAELSHGAGITTEDGGSIVTGGVYDERLRAQAAIYDATLVEHTPVGVLRGSAFNGFNKGIESLYSPSATPVTDATAIRGLRLFMSSLPDLGDDAGDESILEVVLEGSLLVQFGTARPDATNLSAIHAFGHGVTAVAPVQQGIAHAILTPAVLRKLLATGACRHELFMEAFDVDSVDAVIEAIVHLRDILELPGRFGGIDGVDRSMIQSIVDVTADDRLISNLPAGAALTEDDIRDIIEAAW